MRTLIEMDMQSGNAPGRAPAHCGPRTAALVFCSLTVLLTVLLCSGCGGTVTTEAVPPSSSGPADGGGNDTPPGTGSGTGTDTGTGSGTGIPAGNGVAVLSWEAPSGTVSGAQLSLFGYTVYYGTAAGRYSNSIDAGNSTSFTVTGLAEGSTYYFAVTAYDIYGFESDYSEEVSKYIN